MNTVALRIAGSPRARLATLWVAFLVASCGRGDTMGVSTNQDAASSVEADAEARDAAVAPGGNGGAGSGGMGGTGALDAAACYPFTPAPKPIFLGEILGIGQASNGVIYVVDQDSWGAQRVFISSSGALVRQRIVGSGSESNPDGSRSYTFSVSDNTVSVVAGDSSFTIAIEIDGQGRTRMGLVLGALKDKTFVIGQQGEELTMLKKSDVESMRPLNLPGDVHLEYAATRPDGQLLIVTRPTDDWTYSDFRLFLGPPTAVAERKVTNVQRARDGGSTTITFDCDGTSAVAKFPVVFADGGFVQGPATLESGGTSTPLSLLSTLPAGARYLCLMLGSCEVSTDQAGPYQVTFVFQNPGPYSLFMWTSCVGYAISITSCAAQYADDLAPKPYCACDCSNASCKSNPACGACPEAQAVEVRPGEQVTTQWQAETVEMVPMTGPPAYTCAKHTGLPAAKYRIALSVYDQYDEYAHRVGADFELPAPENRVIVDLQMQTRP